MENAGKKRIAILPVARHRGAGRSGALRVELLDEHGKVIETEAPDREEELARLKLLARMAQPGNPTMVLDPGDVYVARLTVARGPGRLFKLDFKRKQWVRVRYDTRPYAEALKALRGKETWAGAVESPMLPLTVSAADHKPGRAAK